MDDDKQFEQLDQEQDLGDTEPTPVQEPDSEPVEADPTPEVEPEPVEADPTPEPEAEPAPQAAYPIPPEIQAIQDQMKAEPDPAPPADFDFAPPSEETQLRIQEALQVLGHYRGKLNGKWGFLSIFGIQTIVAPNATREWQKSRAAGVPDRDLCVLIREYAGYTGENAFLDETAWSDFADALESKV